MRPADGCILASLTLPQSQYSGSYGLVKRMYDKVGGWVVGPGLSAERAALHVGCLGFRPLSHGLPTPAAQGQMRAWPYTPLLGGFLFSMATIALRRNLKVRCAAGWQCEWRLAGSAGPGPRVVGGWAGVEPPRHALPSQFTRSCKPGLALALGTPAQRPAPD